MQDRRTVLKQIATGATVITAGSGVVTARGRGNGRRGASAEQSIVATAEELGFETLLIAVEAADPVVLETLANNDQYTVFAPTEEAFGDFFETVEAATGLTAADLLEALLTDERIDYEDRYALASVLGTVDYDSPPQIPRYWDLREELDYHFEFDEAVRSPPGSRGPASGSSRGPR